MLREYIYIYTHIQFRKKDKIKAVESLNLQLES
jgi:hypothetical protein